MKIATLCAPGLDSFLPGIESVLRREHEVRRFSVQTAEQVDAALRWSDLAWCEWGNEVAWAASSAATRRPIVVRVHRYETALPCFRSIRWERVNRLIVTSDHVLRRAVAAAPGVEAARPVVIPSGIDLAAWPLQPHGRAPRIGVAGYLHGRKQPGLALQVLAAVPGATLHFAGTPQEPHWLPYLDTLARSLGVADRVTFDGWRQGMAAWWADKDYCLSASCDEGMPYNVLEAAALGVQPVVHEYEGARAQYPSAWLWRTVDEAEQAVTAERASTPEQCRAWVAERYSLDAQADALLAVVAEAAR